MPWDSSKRIRTPKIDSTPGKRERVTLNIAVAAAMVAGEALRQAGGQPAA